MKKWYSYRIPYPKWNDVDNVMGRVHERLFGHREEFRTLYEEMEEVVATPGGTAYHIIDAETGDVILARAYFSYQPCVDDIISLYWEPETGASWQDYEVVALRVKDNAKGDKEEEHTWLLNVLVVKSDKWPSAQ